MISVQWFVSASSNMNSCMVSFGSCLGSKIGSNWAAELSGVVCHTTCILQQSNFIMFYIMNIKGISCGYICNGIHHPTLQLFKGANSVYNLDASMQFFWGVYKCSDIPFVLVWRHVRRIHRDIVICKQFWTFCMVKNILRKGFETLSNVELCIACNRKTDYV